MKLRADEQEFQVKCWKPAGEMRRAPRARDQDEESTVVYAVGRGRSLESRIQSARRKTKERMELYGYDRFLVTLTISDSEKRRSTIEREVRERMEQGGKGSRA